MQGFFLEELNKRLIIDIAKGAINMDMYLAVEVIDYLRSISILVPFDKYSTEEIIKMDWAVIK